MIVRVWTGWTRTEQAAAYQAYMHEVALPGYEEIEGNLGVLMLHRELPDRGWTEFTMISMWRSLADVRAFAGSDISRAVFYDRDEAFLVDQQATVTHYEVYGATENLWLSLESGHG